MVAAAANINLYQLELAAVTETLVIEYILQLRIDQRFNHNLRRQIAIVAFAVGVVKVGFEPLFDALKINSGCCPPQNNLPAGMSWFDAAIIWKRVGSHLFNATKHRFGGNFVGIAANGFDE